MNTYVIASSDFLSGQSNPKNYEVVNSGRLLRRTRAETSAYSSQ